MDAHVVIGVAAQAGITLKKGVEDEERTADYYIQQMVEKRDELRAKRQWADADKIRAQLGELGIILEDAPQGTVWRYKR